VTKLLHFNASPRREASHSLAVAKAFLDGHVEANPEAEVEEVDLFDGMLPAFGRLAAEAKMAIFAGAQPSPEQTAEWDTASCWWAIFSRRT
jgi:FMN-dependent NADH-azoreductase